MMMENEWTGENTEPTDMEHKFWGVEDMHGHRYYAQLTDGKDRWMLPLARKQFEELFAAVCEENPWVADTFRTPTNFLRQYIGNMMQWMVEHGTKEPPDHVKRLILLREVADFRDHREELREMSQMLANHALPKQMRVQSGKFLLAEDEDVLQAAIGKDHAQVRDAIAHVVTDS